MYIPTTFSLGERLTASLEDTRKQGLLTNVKPILRGCSRRMTESEKQIREARIIFQKTLNMQIISFQGFGGGHFLHRTR